MKKVSHKKTSEYPEDTEDTENKENKDGAELTDNNTYTFEEFGRDIGLYDKDLLYRIWYKIRNFDAADEIYGDVIADVIKLYNKNKIHSKKDLYCLMNHILRCKCINYMKKKSTQFEELTDSAEMDYFPLPQTYDPGEDSMRVILYEHIARLKDTEQKVVMGKIREIPLVDLAEQLGRSPHAVECIYSRAVKKLKKMIKHK